jgi:hypothetical protein
MGDDRPREGFDKARREKVGELLSDSDFEEKNLFTNDFETDIKTKMSVKSL